MKKRKKRKTSNNDFLLITFIIVLAFYLFSNISSTNFGINNESNGNENSNNENLTEELDIYFIDVGQADSIYLKYGSYNVLIDAGNNNDGSLLVNYLQSLGITNFNYVFGTHAHEDHIGGMDDIINNFDIDTFYMPDKASTSKTYEDVLDALENKNLKYSIPSIGDTYNLDNATLKVLYVGDEGNDFNDSSIILRLDYGNTCALFMGDASSSVEEKLLNEDINCAILKVGHHGSKYSSSENFIKKVSPTYGIISVGKNNKYNHPTSETLDTLEKYNVTIYRTDELGTIIAHLTGDNITFTYERTNTNG